MSAAAGPGALADWVGRTESAEDRVGAAPLAMLSALLDRDDPPAAPGDAIPPLAHWLYFLPTHRQSRIGPDGHAHRGEFLPPVPLPRRMWAGSRVEFLRPVGVGEPVRRLSRIAAVTEKQGRSGPLVFVTVRHEVSVPAGLALVDEHEIVYRGAEGSAAAPARRRAPGRSVVARNPAGPRAPLPLLGGRRSTATASTTTTRMPRGVEGYPGLVVHGPLVATLLVDLLRRNRPGAVLATFSFRARRPLFDTAPFTLCGLPDEAARSARLWTRDADGAVTMDATATWRP